MKVSTGLCHFLVRYLALIAFILKLTAIKKAPNNPHTMPKIIAPGMTSVGVTSAILTFPNLSVEDDQSLNSPSIVASRRAKKNTAEEHVKKVFQRS